MSYKSVDKLQESLTEEYFQYAKDSKKAAGRALGTIVEIITFYLIKTWGLINSISIEKRIPEFGNPNITHNVEYSLHPILNEYSIGINNDDTSITSNQILNELSQRIDITSFNRINNNLISKDGILRNACTIASKDNSNLVATLSVISRKKYFISIAEQSNKPFSIFECKRVGVEQGIKKGPQTIEKAKQGAYVARTISSLQKVRLDSGEIYGVFYKDKKIKYSEPYNDLIAMIIDSNDNDLLKHFILTVGVVSNHGNWFTAEDHNKELKVLAQSYDWLLFLTDSGITKFVDKLILNPAKDNKPIKEAFLASYGAGKKKNQFTKIQMNIRADFALKKYFLRNLSQIEKWFNVIGPATGNINQLKSEINCLISKSWKEIL